MIRPIVMGLLVLALFTACEDGGAPADGERGDITGYWISDDYAAVNETPEGVSVLTCYRGGSFSFSNLDDEGDRYPQDNQGFWGYFSHIRNLEEMPLSQSARIVLNKIWSSGTWIAVDDSIQGVQNIRISRYTGDSFLLEQDGNINGTFADGNEDYRGTFSRGDPLTGTWISNDEGAVNPGIILGRIPREDSTADYLYMVADPAGPLYQDGDDDANLQVASVITQPEGQGVYRLAGSLLNGGWDGNGEKVSLYYRVDGDRLYISEETYPTPREADYVFQRLNEGTTPLHGSWLGTSQGAENPGLWLMCYGENPPYIHMAVALSESPFNIAGAVGGDAHNLQGGFFDSAWEEPVSTVNVNVTNPGWNGTGGLSYYALTADDRLYTSDAAGLTEDNALHVYKRF